MSPIEGMTTIVSVHFETPSLTKAWLNCIRAHYPQVRIIVVDNTDPKDEGSGFLQSQVEYLHLGPKSIFGFRDFACAIDYVIEKQLIDTPYLLTMHTDTWVRPGALEVLYGAIQGYSAAGLTYANARIHPALGLWRMEDIAGLKFAWDLRKHRTDLYLSEQNERILSGNVLLKKLKKLPLPTLCEDAPGGGVKEQLRKYVTENIDEVVAMLYGCKYVSDLLDGGEALCLELEQQGKRLNKLHPSVLYGYAGHFYEGSRGNKKNVVPERLADYIEKDAGNVT